MPCDCRRVFTPGLPPVRENDVYTVHICTLYRFVPYKTGQESCFTYTHTHTHSHTHTHIHTDTYSFTHTGSALARRDRSHVSGRGSTRQAVSCIQGDRLSALSQIGQFFWHNPFSSKKEYGRLMILTCVFVIFLVFFFWGGAHASSCAHDCLARPGSRGL